MGKKIGALLTGFALVMGMLCLPLAGRETDWEEPLEVLKLEEELPASLPVAAMNDSSLPAKSAILMDQQSGMVLYEHGADEPLPPASVTKVMTMLLVHEALDSGRISLDDVVTASENACSMGGSQIWLEPGETMTVDELLKAVTIASANDASVALAEHVAGTEETFIDMMNQRARELGMANTTFLNCTGLDEEGHVTTARDIAIMSRELMRFERVQEYSTVWMDSLRGGETELVNTNRLVRFYEGCTGLKTGTTSGAGSCLSATASRGDLGLVAVVMGCATSDDRFASAKSLLDYGFANYTSAEAPSIDGQLVPVKVLHGVTDQVAVTYDPPGRFVVEKNQEEAIVQEITLVEDVQAPVHVGQVLGKAQVIVGGQVVREYDLRAAQEVERMSVFRAFKILLTAMLNLSSPPRTEPDPSPAGEGSQAGDADLPEGAGDPAPEEAAEPEPCSCGMDTCYCEEIGDICGCTRG